MNRSRLLRYAVAIGATALALAVYPALDPVTHDGIVALIPLFATVVIVGWYIGLGPALASLILGALGAFYFIFPPARQFTANAPGAVGALTVYLILGTACALLGHVVHRSRRLAEDSARAARASESQLASMFNVTSVGMAQADPVTRRFVRVNQALCAITGYSEAELLGLTVDQLNHPDDRDDDRRLYDRLVRGESTYTIEKRYLCKDGRTAWVQVNGSVVCDHEGRPVRAFAVILDITERKGAEEQRKRAEEALREADRRKNAFLAILAHELRNPLAPIRTGLELLRLSGDKPGVLDRIRPVMERQVTHMVRLVDDLLDVSRITAGRIQLQRRPLPLAELVHHAVEANRTAIEAAGLELSVDLPDAPYLLEVDPTRFVQVVSNLLHNATKFTERGGRITVSAKVDEDLVLTVRDTGVGISAAALPHIFDLFVQGEGTGDRQAGLGIGLALARQLIEMHGGRIDAHSDGPGCGASFTIRMPVVTPSAQAAAPEGSQAPRPISHRVLIVDDNIDAADTLAALVTAMGGEAQTASDGQAGLRRAAAFRPDVILLDIGMPGMDGYETCRRLRSEPYGRSAYIVALTGWGQPQDKDRALKGGFDAHLTKPAGPHVLEALLVDIPPSRVGAEAG